MKGGVCGRRHTRREEGSGCVCEEERVQRRGVNRKGVDACVGERGMHVLRGGKECASKTRLCACSYSFVTHSTHTHHTLTPCLFTLTCLLACMNRLGHVHN